MPYGDAPEGPLQGIKVVEFDGLGPAPFCCMMLADMGADVIRIERPDHSSRERDPRFSLLRRSRPSICLDLKDAVDFSVAEQLIGEADVLVEGFRPGVMERLGLGPARCEALNSRLVYGRVTGWGQTGPLAHAPGHDINYIALAGALNAFGEKDGPPVPPLNLLGDFGGGALYLAFGIVCALLETRSSGKGQIVDAAMIDGAASLMTAFFGMSAGGMVSKERGSNLLDGGAPFYGCFATKDGKYISIAPLEKQFYRTFLDLTGLTGLLPDEQPERASWESCKRIVADRFRTKTRAEWCALLEGSDVCFAPVLDLDEAMDHPHNLAREVFVELAGVRQPAPAPRFSRTRPRIQCPPNRPDEHPADVLRRWRHQE